MGFLDRKIRTSFFLYSRCSTIFALLLLNCGNDLHQWFSVWIEWNRSSILWCIQSSTSDVENFEMTNPILSSFNNITHLILFPWLMHGFYQWLCTPDIVVFKTIKSWPIFHSSFWHSMNRNAACISLLGNGNTANFSMKELHTNKMP